MSWIENPGEYSLRGLDLSMLKVDEAYLNITTDEPFHLYSLSDDCYRCPFYHFKKILESKVLSVSTRRDVIWRLYNVSRDVNDKKTIADNDTDMMLCEIRPKDFGEFGIYDLIYENDQCDLHVYKRPVNIYLPLLLICLGLLIIAVLYSFISLIYNRWIRKNNTDESNTGKITRRRRVKALDTFRGISICVMIFVNYGAGHYWFLDHATWNGLQVADLVFPWFMWIMGVCVPISIKSQLKKNVPRIKIFINSLRRSLILFLLGLCLNTLGIGANLNTLRLFGVLQRFSVVYFVIAIISIIFTFNDYDNSNRVSQSRFYYSNIWLIILILLAVHCYFTFFFPVPGCPTGYLGPGGIQYDSKYENCTGGAAGYIDKLLLGYNHLYQKPTSADVYKTEAFDPEGPLGCLTSIFQVFLGVQAGSILVYHSKWHSRIKRWLIWGTISGIIGIVLCQARQDGGWVPLNKNIWSLPFACVTSCLGFYLLCLLYYLIDIKAVWTGAPFVYPGMNATILYVGHSICYEMFPWHWSYGYMNTHFILTLEALWGTALWVVIAYWLYREKFFLSL
ncbi:hypothetical protein AAG570_006502 [Ranatra chinensis]|uniref:Heparan-alpha-glucosaminide N-acetyltransferase n=1 Tax=Ranatra chinensis TaxID=642074 RepID=A0ABD0YWB3_9HEMI